MIGIWILFMWKVYVSLFSISEEDRTMYKIKTEEYLRNKYQLEFMVTDIRYIHVNERLQITAYPRDIPEQIFYVHTTLNSNGFTDGYLDSLWSYQAKKELEPLIRELYPENPHFITGIGLNRDYKDELVSTLGRIPSYQDVRNEYPDKMSQMVELVLFKDMDESNKKEQFELIYQLVLHAKKLNIKDFNILVNIYKKQFEKKGKIVAEEKGPSYVEKEFQLDYYGDIDFKRFNSIHKLEDIEQYINKIK